MEQDTVPNVSVADQASCSWLADAGGGMRGTRSWEQGQDRQEREEVPGREEGALHASLSKCASREDELEHLFVGVTGMAALSTRAAFLILLPTLNMALCSPLNCVAPPRPAPWDKGGGGAVPALDWRDAPARTGSGSPMRELQIPDGYYSDS